MIQNDYKHHLKSIWLIDGTLKVLPLWNNKEFRFIHWFYCMSTLGLFNVEVSLYFFQAINYSYLKNNHLKTIIASSDYS